VDCLHYIKIGAEYVVGGHLGVDDAVEVVYNTIVVNGYQERMWVGVRMVRVLL
jgi:hypothetical protein